MNEIQKVIVSSGYDYGDREWSYKTFPLYKVVENRDIDIDLVESLLIAGADPNLQKADALNAIIINDNYWNENTIKILELMIKHGASIHYKDDDKNTLLHHVAYSYTNKYAEKIMTLLIKNGAKINVKNRQSEKPYDSVIASHQWIQNQKYPPSPKILNLLKYNIKNKE